MDADHLHSTYSSHRVLLSQSRSFSWFLLLALQHASVACAKCPPSALPTRRISPPTSSKPTCHRQGTATRPRRSLVHSSTVVDTRTKEAVPMHPTRLRQDHLLRTSRRWLMDRHTLPPASRPRRTRSRHVAHRERYPLSPTARPLALSIDFSVPRAFHGVPCPNCTTLLL